MVFDSVLNEPGVGQGAGYHKQPEKLKKRKT